MYKILCKRTPQNSQGGTGTGPLSRFVQVSNDTCTSQFEQGRSGGRVTQAFGKESLLKPCTNLGKLILGQNRGFEALPRAAQGPGRAPGGGLGGGARRCPGFAQGFLCISLRKPCTTPPLG